MIDCEIKNDKIKHNVKYDSLVLSGGGIKGFSYIGAIKKLQELDNIKNINNFSGTSIGSVFCFLIILGYRFKELFNIFLLIDLDISKQLSIKHLFTEKWGMNNFIKFITMIKIATKHKDFSPDITFSELFQKTNKVLFITATKLNPFEETTFSHITSPDFKVIDAISCSINIPILFNKIQINNDYYIDGAFTNNFPIEPIIKYCKFDSLLCLCLCENKTNTNNTSKPKIENIIEYLSLIIKGIHKQYNKICKKNLVFNKYINSNKKIDIYEINNNFSSTKFDITMNDKLSMILNGYNYNSYVNKLVYDT